MKMSHNWWWKIFHSFANIQYYEKNKMLSWVFPWKRREKFPKGRGSLPLKKINDDAFLSCWIPKNSDSKFFFSWNICEIRLRRKKNQKNRNNIYRNIDSQLMGHFRCSSNILMNIHNESYSSKSIWIWII